MFTMDDKELFAGVVKKISSLGPDEWDREESSYYPEVHVDGSFAHTYFAYFDEFTVRLDHQKLQLFAGREILGNPFKSWSVNYYFYRGINNMVSEYHKKKEADEQAEREAKLKEASERNLEERLKEVFLR